MRPFFILLLTSIAATASGQSLSDKYLHYRTDSYWDTTLYRSERGFYYDMSGGWIRAQEYPVAHYLFTRVLSDTPYMTKDTFEVSNWPGVPYRFIRKGKEIYLRYFEFGKQKAQERRKYSLNARDTVRGLAEKVSMENQDAISLSGSTTYLGEQALEIGGRRYQTYHFREDHEVTGFDGGAYIRDLFLEQSTLIPLKSVTRSYDPLNGEKSLYSHITVLDASGNALPDYKGKTTKDLVLYERKDSVWTGPQKQAFLRMFPADRQDFAACLLKKLDGHISFFHFEQSMTFKALVIKKVCE